MPLPKPSKDEDFEAFKDRCMGDDKMNEEFPESKQRYKVCESRYKKYRKGGDNG